MRAVYYEQFKQIPEIRDVPDPVAPPDGVVIKVEATGLCRSDWHGWMGHDADIQLPHVPGHEFAGIVVEKGRSVTSLPVGARVTVPFAMGCGACSACREGNLHICDRYYQPGFTGWGSFAEYVSVPHADLNLVALPDEISMETAASLGCRFTTAYRAIVFQGRVAENHWVAVHGLGGVGLSAVMIAKSLGARVIGIDIRERARNLALRLGADHTIDASKNASVPSEIRTIAPDGVHISIDALGSIKTFSDSVESLKKRGKHVQVGLLLASDANPPADMSRVIARELEIIGSHGMPSTDYQPLLDAIVQGTLKPDLLVGRRIALEETPFALSTMGDFNADGMTMIFPNQKH